MDKKIWTILTALVLLISCSKGEEKTIVEGQVTDEEGVPIPEVTVGFFQETYEMTFSPFELIAETKTDKDGYYKISSDQDLHLVSAVRTGFFDLEGRDREITPKSHNQLDIVMNRGCKVNLTLDNPNNYGGICIFLPYYSECNGFKWSECFSDTSQVKTTCYIKGGDTTKITYNSIVNYNRQGNQYKFVYFPKGGEVDVTLVYQ